MQNFVMVTIKQITFLAINFFLSIEFLKIFLSAFLGAFCAYKFNLFQQDIRRHEENKSRLYTLIVNLMSIVSYMAILRTIFLEKEKCYNDYVKHTPITNSENISRPNTLLMQILNEPECIYNVQELTFVAGMNLRLYQVILQINLMIKDLKQVISTFNAFIIENFSQSGLFKPSSGTFIEAITPKTSTRLDSLIENTLRQLNLCLPLSNMMIELLNDFGKKKIKQYKKIEYDISIEKMCIPDIKKAVGFESFSDVLEAFEKITQNKNTKDFWFKKIWRKLNSIFFYRLW